MKKSGEESEIDKADEMLECVLQSLQYLLKGIKKEQAVNLATEELIKLSRELTQHSPHANLEYVSAGMEEE